MVNNEQWRVFATGGGHLQTTKSLVDVAAQVRGIVATGTRAAVDRGSLLSSTAVYGHVDGEWLIVHSTGDEAWMDKILTLLRKHG